MLLEFLQTFAATLSFLYLLFHSLNNFLPASVLLSVALIWSVSRCDSVLLSLLNADMVFSLSAVFLLLVASLKGAVLALPCFVGIEMASSGTRLVDLLRGAMIAEQLSPLNNSRVSQLESIMRLAFLLVFIRSEHFAYLLAEVSKSPIPADASIKASAGMLGVLRLEGLWQSVVNLLGSVSLRVLIVYAPLILVISLLDLALLYSAKLFPKINLSQELAPLRLLLGLGLFFLILQLNPQSITQLLSAAWK